MAEIAVTVQGTTVILTELLLYVITGLAGILTVIDFVTLTEVDLLTLEATIIILGVGS
jgi:uncharacterized membrane protein